ASLATRLAFRAVCVKRWAGFNTFFLFLSGVSISWFDQPLAGFRMLRRVLRPYSGVNNNQISRPYAVAVTIPQNTLVLIMFLMVCCLVCLVWKNSMSSRYQGSRHAYAFLHTVELESR